MANKTLEEANSSRLINLELKIENSIVDTGNINYGESKSFTIDNNKFKQGSSDLNLYVNEKLADTTQIMRKVPNFADIDIVKPGIGDNEDLMPHIQPQQDECQNDTLSLYLNGYQQQEKKYYPEVKSLFRLWAEGQREAYRALPYEVDILTYPNLEYDYTLRKIDPADGTCFAEWHSADHHNNLGITYPESPLPLPNGLDWEPTGHIVGEELEFEYKIYVEVYTAAISKEDTDPESITTEIQLKDSENFFTTEDSITVTMDEDKKISGHFGSDQNIKANFYGLDIKKVYQPEGIEETHTATISAGQEILLEDLMTPQQLENSVDTDTFGIGDVIIEIVDIKNNHTAEDITFIPGAQFDYETYKDSSVKAENDTYDTTGCLEPAIEVIDHSHYNYYSSVDAEIKFANGDTVAYSPQDLLGYNNYMFDKNSYNYEEIHKYDDEVRVGHTNLIELPDIDRINGTNRDIIEDVSTSIEDDLNLEEIEINNTQKFISDSDMSNYNNYTNENMSDNVPTLHSIYINRYELVGNMEAFITRYDRIIGNIKNFKTDLSYRSLVVFAYNLQQGSINLDWKYADIRSDKVEDHMTLAHNINFIENLPTNDILKITPDLTNIDKDEGHTYYQDFSSKKIYLKTDMFYSSINGQDYNKQQNIFNIPYQILSSEIQGNKLPIILGNKEYRITIPLFVDTDYSTLKVYGEVVRAEVKESGFVATNSTYLTADNDLECTENNCLWKDNEITTKGQLLIKSEYTALRSHNTFWQSPEPAVIKLIDICPDDVRITPDNINNLFTSQNISHYWDIPDKVHGPYTLSIDSDNPLVAHRVNYFSIPHEFTVTDTDIEMIEEITQLSGESSTSTQAGAKLKIKKYEQNMPTIDNIGYITRIIEHVTEQEAEEANWDTIYKDRNLLRIGSYRNAKENLQLESTLNNIEWLIPNINVEYTFHDKENNPAEGAEISYTDHEGIEHNLITDEYGKVVLENLTNGEYYQISIAYHDDISEFTEHITRQEADDANWETIYRDISLLFIDVGYTIHDEEDNPAEGAEVSYTDQQELEHNLTTDEHGEVILENLRPDTDYQISIEYDNEVTEFTEHVTTQEADDANWGIIYRVKILL